MRCREVSCHSCCVRVCLQRDPVLEGSKRDVDENTGGVLIDVVWLLVCCSVPIQSVIALILILNLLFLFRYYDSLFRDTKQGHRFTGPTITQNFRFKSECSWLFGPLNSIHFPIEFLLPVMLCLPVQLLPHWRGFAVFMSWGPLLLINLRFECELRIIHQLHVSLGSLLELLLLILLTLFKNCGDSTFGWSFRGASVSFVYGRGKSWLRFQ